MFDFDDDWEYVKKGDMTEEELESNLTYLKNHPLFMKEVPENIEENPEFQAIQNLAFDDTPENIARNCNERGNAIFKKNPDLLFYLREALKSYEEGIAIKCSDNKINVKLYSNRSLINFKLKNYGKVVADCKIILELNPKYIKAYFRKASSLFMIGKFEEGLEICTKALEIDQNNNEILTLKKEIQKKLEQKLLAEKKKTDSYQKSFQNLIESCKNKSFLIGKSNIDLPELYNKQLSFDKENNLHTPMLIYYPEFNQTDFIQECHEKDLLVEHLSEIFKEKLPWDDKNYYKDWQNLKYFIQIKGADPYYILKNNDPNKFSQTGFTNININENLINIMKIEGHVIPMMLEIYVLSEKSPFFNIFLNGNKIYPR